MGTERSSRGKKKKVDRDSGLRKPRILSFPTPICTK